jgi:hypothetical protein
MNHRKGRRGLGPWLLSIAGVVLGGCQLLPPPADIPLLPPPGTYYLEAQDGQLYFYQLAEVRGANNEWVALPDAGAWFTGPGFYRLSEDSVWSRDENTEGMTLDDLIQLHDPAPPPEEAAEDPS